MSMECLVEAGGESVAAQMKEAVYSVQKSRKARRRIEWYLVSELVKQSISPIAFHDQLTLSQEIFQIFHRGLPNLFIWRICSDERKYVIRKYIRVGI